MKKYYLLLTFISILVVTESCDPLKKSRQEIFERPDPEWVQNNSSVIRGKKNSVVQFNTNINIIVSSGNPEELLPILQYIENTYDALLSKLNSPSSDFNAIQAGKALIRDLRNSIDDKILKGGAWSSSDRKDARQKMNELIRIQDRLMPSFAGNKRQSDQYDQLDFSWQSVVKHLYRVNIAPNLPSDNFQIIDRLTNITELTLIGQSPDPCYKGGGKSSSDDFLASPLQSLSGLNHIPYLENLYLSGHDLSDLSSLRNTPLLTILNVDCSNLSSLSGIETARTLRTLSCINNDLQTLKGIERLYFLENLSCEGNPIADISSLLDLLSGPNSLSWLTMNTELLDKKDLYTLKQYLRLDEKLSDSTSMVFAKK
ncbi:MAG: hypothetical protein MI974_13285 [Chitinophagales bacterium]|nr:hypothetical protein [Chitinophagales bacterium]